jgi:predicted Fe-Mo cluster-binding NifX family protein
MRTAIPVYNGRVSPVFDTARHILIVDIEAGEQTARAERDVAALSLWKRAKLLSEQDVSSLICGAISVPAINLVTAHGVAVVNNVAGDVDEVLRAYAGGTLSSPEFMMPGCCGRRGRRSRHGHGRRCL